MKPMHLGHVVQADARFRLFAFAPAGDTGQPGDPIARLCRWLAHDPASPILRHTPKGADIDSVIDLRVIFQPGVHEVDFATLPALLRPATGRLGLTDYEKAFCADPKAGDLFDLRQIDRAQGCLVIVRPDQHVGDLMPLTDTARLSAYFAGILR